MRAIKLDCEEKALRPKILRRAISIGSCACGPIQHNECMHGMCRALSRCISHDNALWYVGMKSSQDPGSTLFSNRRFICSWQLSTNTVNNILDQFWSVFRLIEPIREFIDASSTIDFDDSIGQISSIDMGCMKFCPERDRDPFQVGSPEVATVTTHTCDLLGFCVDVARVFTGSSASGTGIARRVIFGETLLHFRKRNLV